MSVHDALTGLYNRAYFEEVMAEWEEDVSNPAGLILCGVDGWKIVDEVFGRGTGDRLLLTAAELLTKAVREDGLVARIGDDEFGILLSGRTREEIEGLSLMICHEADMYNPELPLSISVGYGTNRSGQRLSGLFQEADRNIDQTGLCRCERSRSGLVDALSKALKARDFLTEAHADRFEDAVVRMGMTLGFSAERIHSLRLLARFHDIGKIGIPERILFKQGPLTADEYTIVKGHAEIGRRIAQSVPELASIADRIVKHHERWDGKGYPLGLAGEDIPLDCRIISIADAYDAMVSDRPYRKALPMERVMQELRRCAGTQFDPNLAELFIQEIQGEGTGAVPTHGDGRV